MYQTRPARMIKGEISVAPDKSISHRSLIFSSLAEGESRIENLLPGEDVLRTLVIVNQLGVETSRDPQTVKHGESVVIKGAGLHGYAKPDAVLYCGNSGTTMRLFLGLLAGQKFTSVLTGDASLNRRPMDRVMDPLKKMGASFKVFEQQKKRMIQTGSADGDAGCLSGIHYHMPVASAQVKTALLLAGLNAAGETKVTEPGLSRNHTEIMLKAMGANIKTSGLSVAVKPVACLRPLDITIPGDISSAAFFIVAAVVLKGSDILLRNISLNPTRTGILDCLISMGADIKTENLRDAGGEIVGDLRVRGSRLKNIAIGGSLIPRLIDEIPILALAGAVAEGTMTVSDAKELRVKESDRIHAVCAEFKKLGVNITERPDGFVIEGAGGAAPFGRAHPVTVSSQKKQIHLSSYGDHRMAMMETVAGLLLDQPAVIDDTACVNTSFPQFFNLMGQVMMG
ncbi:MAG: 3-phosphoshikimate 1-carboxyvinyltransferase [Deltaproteobacteria bacterium]|nr:3-phosphoshikimate 1-carboxyvinyltransferase [Deltaproteobacteria bacterium]